MDIILKFDRVNYEKHGTCRINIENGILFPEEVKESCKVLKIDKRNTVIGKLLYSWTNPVHAI